MVLIRRTRAGPAAPAWLCKSCSITRKAGKTAYCMAIAAITAATGERPLGWYTGRSSPNTRALVVEEGGFLYDADDYSDELPFWNTQYGDPHLVIPYTLDANDMRFATAQGFNSGAQFLEYLQDSCCGRFPAVKKW